MLTRPDPPRQSQAIAALRDFIEEGSYGPGDRLPAERELMSDLGMSRATLRKALDALEREGAIWRHVGKGTFISDTRHDSALDDLAEIGTQLTPVRMMRARLCIESAIAREAAVNASAAAVAHIHLARTRAESASSWAEYEAQDDLFHRAVAEASDNILLLSIFNKLNRVRRTVGWTAVVRETNRPPDEHTSFAEHRHISDAIEARDPARAYDAMRNHIGSVSARLFGEV
ncbi:Putative L-lactate dehydrogenase operon regulatory protein [Defluviimonas aquaemixtae]|uniref:L-lactate dehydrogenase operon regulatory protein n=1 Tax=Albidovulum aquaemixtae TaxID=1542388 RepID=A0A2R8B6J6_9RHOB|nr:FCD domain-containing protein [Defluviimonas aquaemixtae]SPH18186.1 Putative L-lactate dehydrogenase operon regulatory protein [Defluviimonas aquaemixtae]